MIHMIQYISRNYSYPSDPFCSIMDLIGGTMKFEKISQDKIKVTINQDDLEENEIDFHSLISDSGQSESFFLDVLETAEKDFGFSTKDYNLKVETAALGDDAFILTITRLLDSPHQTDFPTFEKKKTPTAKRKNPTFDTSIVYQFRSFDDFCNFIHYLSNVLPSEFCKLAKDTSLYVYQGVYYLILQRINTKLRSLKKAFSLITEFATYVSSSDVFIAKIFEVGKPVFSEKAFERCLKYFSI